MVSLSLLVVCFLSLSITSAIWLFLILLDCKKPTLVRVTGGDASVIDGLIKVTGGNSNLFLVNPAGIIFGSNSSINVPASFTATTANGIKIDEFWFDVLGDNNYDNLVGEPNSFAFVTDTPGAIVNAGNLAVEPGESISLLGGLVINTGKIEAPGGTIDISAVPGKQLVEITPEGALLSLALPTEVESTFAPDASMLIPTDLPTLLTGGDVEAVTRVEVVNGVITLSGSDTEIPQDSGTTVASGELNVSSNIGGNINLLGDTVGVISGDLKASGTDGGGNILIGGDYKGQGIVPNATLTAIDSNSIISANAIENGNGGKVIAWSDNTTIFSGDISVTGGSNSGNGGFVEVSGKQEGIVDGNVDISAANGNNGTVLFDPAVIEVVDSGDNNIELSDGQILAGDGTDETFTISADALENGTVVLEATDRITFNTDVVFEDLTARVVPLEGETGVIEVFGTLQGKNLQFSVFEPEPASSNNIPDRKLNLENHNGDINIIPPNNFPSLSDLITGDLQITAINGNIFIDDNITVFKSLKVESENGNITIGKSGSPKRIEVGLDLLFGGLDGGVGDSINDREAFAEIVAPRGTIELFGGIVISQNSNLSIDTGRFLSPEGLTLEVLAGNENGEFISAIRDSNGRLVRDRDENIILINFFPGTGGANIFDDFGTLLTIEDRKTVSEISGLGIRIDEEQPFSTAIEDDDGNIIAVMDENGMDIEAFVVENLGEDTFNISVSYFAGFVDIGEVFKNPPPNLKLSVEFLSDNGSSSITCDNCEIFSDPNNPIADAEVNILLRQDTSFTIGEEITSSLSSGISENIVFIPVVNTNGSNIAGGTSFGNGSFAITSSDDSEDKIAASSTEPLETEFCGGTFTITQIAGQDRVKATCDGQTLAFIFTQPKDDFGNPIPLKKELFPELLTGENSLKIDKNTNWYFWKYQDSKGNQIEFSFDNFNSEYKFK